MNAPVLKRVVSAARSSIDVSRERQCLAARQQVLAPGLVAFMLVLAPQLSFAETATSTGSFATGQVKTLSPNIGGTNVQTTTFTGYTQGPWNYTIHTFFVGTSGTYTATSATATATNTTWLLNGIFSPSLTAPATPLSDFIVSVLANNATPHVGTFTGFTLTAGQQYSFFVAYNTGALPGDLSTITITGNGCIRFGTVNMCNSFVPVSSATSSFVPVSSATSIGAARTLENMSNGSSAMTSTITVLSALNDAQRRSVLEKLVPVPSRALQVASINSMAGAFDRMGGRLEALRVAGNSFDAASLASSGGLLTGMASGDEPAKHGVWLKTYGLKGSQGQKDGYAGYGSDGWGLVGGVDRELSPGVVAGIALSFSDTSVSYNDQLLGNGNDVKSTQLSVYASKNLGTMYVDGMASYAQQRNSSRRDTVVSGYASGEFGGSQWGARIGTGMPIALSGNLSITPQARLEWNRVQQDRYTESGGGALALNVASSSADRVRTSMGGQLNYDTLFAGVKTQPYVNFFWHHDFKNNGVNSTASFVGGGSAFATPGQKLDRDTYSLGAGVNFFTRENFTAGLSYYLTKGSSYTGQSVQATARWDF